MAGEVVPEWLEIIVILLFGILMFVFGPASLGSPCTTKKGLFLKLLERIAVFIVVITEFMIGILQYIQYNNLSNKALPVAIRSIIIFGDLFSPFVIISFIVEYINALYHVKTGFDAPIWYQRLWYSMMGVHWVIAFITLIYTLIALKMDLIYIYDHFFNFWIIIGGTMFLRQLISFRLSLTKEVKKSVPMNGQSQKTRNPKNDTTTHPNNNDNNNNDNNNNNNETAATPTSQDSVENSQSSGNQTKFKNMMQRMAKLSKRSLMNQGSESRNNSLQNNGNYNNSSNSIDHSINYTQQIRKAKIQLDSLVIFGSLLTLGSVVNEILLLTGSDADDNIYASPFATIVSYLSHFIGALAMGGAFIIWLVLPIIHSFQDHLIPDNSCFGTIVLFFNTQCNCCNYCFDYIKIRNGSKIGGKSGQHAELVIKNTGENDNNNNSNKENEKNENKNKKGEYSTTKPQRSSKPTKENENNNNNDKIDSETNLQISKKKKNNNKASDDIDVMSSLMLFSDSKGVKLITSDDNEHYFLSMVDTTMVDFYNDNDEIKTNAINDAELNNLTFDLKEKGKRNRNKVEKVDIKNMDRNTFVSDEQQIIQLRGRRNTFDQSITVDNEMSHIPSFGSHLTRKSVVSATLPEFDLMAPNKHKHVKNGLNGIDENGAIEHSDNNDGKETVLLNMGDSGVENENENETDGVVNDITLILYEFHNILLTSMKLYDEYGLTTKSNRKKKNGDSKASVSTIRRMDIHDIMLTFGGKERMDQLQEHFEFVLKDNDDRKEKRQKQKGNENENENEKKRDKNENKSGDQVLCFLLSNDFDTEMMYEIMRRCKLAQYFQTKVKEKHYMCHVIGKNHFLKKMEKTANEREYLTILKIMHILERSNENVLYIGHNKELIDHLSSINACHTYYVKTPGITMYDFKYISQKFGFGDLSM